MQVSTKIYDEKERAEIYKQISDQYHTTDGDFYLKVLSDKFNYFTKGPLTEFRTIDIGEASRQRRIERLSDELASDSESIVNTIDEIALTLENSKRRKSEVKSELTKLNKEIGKFRKIKNLTKKLTKDLILQKDYESLFAKQSNLETELQSLESIIEEGAPEINNQIKAYVEKKEIIEAALIREQTYKIIEEDRLELLETQKTKLLTKLTELEKTEKRVIDVNGNSGLLLKIRKNLKKNDRINTFLDKQAIKRGDVLVNVEIRAIRLEIRRLTEMIGRIENRMISKGRVRERYYLTKQFNQKGDLVVFSRRFAGATNIESEMTHTPRINIDTTEAMKTQFYLIYILMGVNLYLLVSDFLGWQTDLVNYHSFYWFAGTLMMFRNAAKVQKKDPIHEARYYFFDSSYIDIQYRDTDNSLRTLKALCYHLELFYSDKQNISTFVQTTESDIIEAQDTRMFNLAQSQQKEISLLNLTVNASQGNEKVMMNQNQELVNKNTHVEENVKAKLRSEQQILDPKKESQSLENIAQSIIRYAGIVIIIIIVGDRLSGIGGIINITSSGENGIDWTISAGIGFILGVLTVVLANRLQKS